jgi:ATP-binding cassette subfamily A (ABC1) protein 3
MYKGLIKAHGTSSTLKNSYGNGYTIKLLAQNTNLDIPLSGPFEKEVVRHQVVYRVPTAALAAELVEFLEKKKIADYQVSGPTFEELFLKVTGDTIHSNDGTSTPSTDHNDKNEDTQEDNVPVIARGEQDLLDGRPISAFKQWWILFCKRFRILRRRYIPYFVAVAFAIVGAAVAPLLIKSFRKPMECPTGQDVTWDYLWRQDFGTTGLGSNYVFGPASALSGEKLKIMTDTYSVNHMSYISDYSGYKNVTQLKSQLVLVNTLDEFTKVIEGLQTLPSEYGYYGTWNSGGIWVGDKPAVVYNGQTGDSSIQMQNFLNVVMSGVPISTAYSRFPTVDIPEIFNFKPLLFILYYGLISAAYPAFFALYPTNERITNVRSMQYSNGIRPLPLWLSHLAFDGIFITVISVVAIALISISTPIWVGLGYIWVILFLYGICAALVSYLMSMFAKSPVTAWFMLAFSQVILYFAYFGGHIGIQSQQDYSDIESSMNKLYFGLAIISPVVSLERAFTIGLGQFATLCNGHSLASIKLFGGPIMYLILQIFVLFTILLWWDSSFTLPTFVSRKPVHDDEKTEMQSQDLMEELKRLSSSSTDLRVESVSRKFGKNLAVSDVTFAVQTSEIFALLGPNGAGKSTVISMIRGDIKPSTSESSIHIANHSILTSPIAARASLGVCPQFDSADVLTVTETLRFFAKTRGVSNPDHNVGIVIVACGLEGWKNQLAHKLSGGTKRKLSLAVALVGNPRVLVLDEPSSALDANAKRNMWHTLQRVSKGRAVVLTTHSMEEADALADRIGIVSSRMLAIGSREALKKRAGDAFHIHLVSRSAPRTSPEELQTMKTWIAEEFPRATINRETQGGQLRFEVPAEGYNFGGLLRTLEAAKGDLGVEFYSVGKATLDEVFEKIVKRYGGGYTEK